MIKNEGPPGADARIFLAMIATFLVMAIFFPGPPVDQSTTAPQSSTQQAELGTPELARGAPASASELGNAAPAALTPEQPALELQPVQQSSFSNSDWESSFSSRSAGPTSFVLKNYTGPRPERGFFESVGSLFGGDEEASDLEACPESQSVNLIEQEERSFLSLRMAGSPSVVGSRGWQIADQGDDFITYLTVEGDLEVRRTYRLPETGYYLEHQVSFRNTGGSTLQLNPVMEMSDLVLPDTNSGGMLFGRFGGRQRGVTIDTGGIKSWLAHELAEKAEVSRDGGVRWAGISEQYFLSVLVPQGQALEAASARGVFEGGSQLDEESAGPAVVSVELPLGRHDLAAGSTASFDFGLYMGPKVMTELAQADRSLKDSVDFGFLAFIAAPIHWVLVFLNKFVHSYGIAIILLTVLMKMLLFPLNQKAGRSMKAMQALQPQLKELQEKYEDDPQGKNLATMELFKKEGVNPMGGCLPMLLQMPIWFALYRVLWVSIELYHEPFMYLCDLTVKDPYGLLPVLYGVAMYANQLIMPNTISDPTQKMVMRVMPLLFVPVMFGLPSGLILYIVVSIILGAVQQWYINKSLSTPESTG